MTIAINRVAVIGAGVMGAGIAAQAANGGAKVLLLDRVPDNLAATASYEQRNAIANGAIERFIRQGCTGGLMHPSVADQIETGNTEDDFHRLAGYDWIIEVIVEDLAVKQALYKRIETVRAPHAIVSSNTSTIPLAKLTEGMPESFCQHFVVSHYFNPPRYMPLLELVTGEHTKDEVALAVERFNDYQMGKSVIHCADRPGFIANRLGVFWMQLALQEAIRFDLTVEDADAIMQACGFPKTGIFGLWDLCGIDLMPEVSASLARLLPDSDDFSGLEKGDPVIGQMLAKGYSGRKGKVLQGFYRQFKDDSGQKVRQVLDLHSVEYRELQPTTLLGSQIRTGDFYRLLNIAGEPDQQDIGTAYARSVLSRMLSYASQLVPHVTADPSSVDLAMKLGYNWRFGPFEMIQKIGAEPLNLWLQQSQREPLIQIADTDSQSHSGIAQTDITSSVNDGPSGDDQLADISRRPFTLAQLPDDAVIMQSDRSRLWQLDSQEFIHAEGDTSTPTLLCLQLTDRINPLSEGLLDDIEQALNHALEQQQPLVIFSQGPVFIAGADLKAFLKLTEQADGIDRYIRRGQALFYRIETASIPVVAAMSGKALGGGLELALHCHGIQAVAESHLGLVENLVGIVPGWGGCKHLLARTCAVSGPDQAIKATFSLIRDARVTASAHEAKALGILRAGDGITMNPDRLLEDALQRAIRLNQQMLADPQDAERGQDESGSAQTLSASSEQALPLTPVTEDQLTMAEEGYQQVLEQSLLKLLNSAADENGYQNFYDAERLCNLALIQHPGALERMRYFLDKGRPLQN